MTSRRRKFSPLNEAGLLSSEQKWLTLLCVPPACHAKCQGGDGRAQTFAVNVLEIVRHGLANWDSGVK